MTHFSWVDGSIVGLYLVATMIAGVLMRKYVARVDHFLVGEEQYRRGDWEQAMNSFNRALSLQPGHFWAQFFLAVCQLKGQHWEAAGRRR